MMDFVHKLIGFGRKLMSSEHKIIGLVHNVRNSAKYKELNTDLIIGTVFVTIVVAGLSIMVAVLGRLYFS